MERVWRIPLVTPKGGRRHVHPRLDTVKPRRKAHGHDDRPRGHTHYPQGLGPEEDER
jgi:hypothetical protein